MNLLPFEIRLRQIVTVRLRAWCGIWIVLTALAAGWCLMAMRPLEHTRVTRDELQRLAEPVIQLRGQNERGRANLDQLSRQESIVRELDRDESPLALIELVSRGAAATSPRLQVRRLSMSHVDPPESDAGSPGVERPQTETIRLTVQGIAADDLAVAEFASVLRSARLFDSVELKSSRAVTVATHPARHYELECSR